MPTPNYKFELLRVDGSAQEFLLVNDVWVVANRNTFGKQTHWSFCHPSRVADIPKEVRKISPVMLSIADKELATQHAYDHGIEHYPLEAEAAERPRAPTIKTLERTVAGQDPDRPCCANCVFWFRITKPHDNGMGFCNRYPPTAQVVGQRDNVADDAYGEEKFIFAKATPMTKAVHWCGEHKTKEQYKNG